MTTNVTKSSTTVSITSKSDVVAWSDSVATWGDFNFQWATQGRLPTNSTKSSVTITNIQKS